MLAGSSPVKGTKNKGESMFSNITGQIGTIVDDGTIPDTTGSIVVNRNSYVTAVGTSASNSIDAGIHAYAGPSLGYHSPVYTNPYNLQERHKTYKILSSVMSEYKKHKNLYNIIISGGSSNNLYMIPNEAITIKMSSSFGISFFNNKENKNENIGRISENASEVLQDCIVEFLQKHAEEFMELVVENVKKDVIKYAKQEGDRIKDQLEFVEMIEKMED